MAKLVLLNKPFNVLSQFKDSDGRPTLADFVDIPEVYPAGRLDYDSEGLMLLTDSGPLQHLIAHPDKKLEKTYWAQVEGIPDAQAIKQLAKGVILKDGLTKPAKAKLIDEPSGLWARTPPIRERASIPTQWVELTISEGKNRQVRRMTAAVGHPTLRLVRARIGDWSLEELAPGEHTTKDVEAPAARAKRHHFKSRANSGQPNKRQADSRERGQKTSGKQGPRNKTRRR